MPDVAQLSIKITADDKQATQAIDNVDKQVKKAGGWKDALSSVFPAFAGFSLANAAGDAVGFLKDQLGDMISSGMDANRMQSVLAQGLKSTHDASGQTTDSLEKLSTHIMGLSGIDDDAVQGAEQMLLTFTGIGKNAFPAATQAVADMATRLNGGAIPSAQQMNTVALQLGKALNDPAKGLTMLTREGVTFTDQQQAQIKAMVASGNTAGAQALMLQELNKEFGGSAEAAGKANGGIAIFQAELDNAKQTIGQAMIPILTSLMSAITPLVVNFADNLPTAIATVQAFLQNLQPGLTVTRDVLGFVKDQVVDLASAIQQQGPVIQALEAVFIGISTAITGKLIVAFVQSIPALAAQAIGWISDAAAATGAALAEAAAALPLIAVGVAIGGLILIIKLLIDHWSQVSAFFGNFKDAVGNLLGAIGNFVGTALGDIGSFVGGALGFFGNLRDQAVAKILQLVLAIIGPQGIGGLPQKLTELAGQMLQGFIQGILQGTANVLSSVRNFGSSVVNELKGFLGIHSPSTMFASIGSDSAAGYAQGISSGKGAAASAAQRVAKAATDQMNSKQNMQAAYDAGEALIQSLADGTYAINVQENVNAGASIIASTTIGKGAPRHFASGGLITEPVIGYGQQSGALYTFAENGSETVVPHLYGGSGASSGAGSSGSGSNSSAAAQPQPIILQVDGRTLAQILLPHTVQQIRNAVGIRHM